MNIPLTLLLSLAATLGGGVAKKYYTEKVSTGLSTGFVFNAVSCLGATLVLLCWGGFGASSVFTTGLGILFGAVTAFQGIANIAALQVGPMSYTAVIISFSTLISALSGVAFFGESLGWIQGVGIAMMLGSFVLAIKKEKAEKKANFKWLALCLFTFAATGAIGIMQKVHQSSAYRDEMNAFLVTAFLSSAVFCAILAVWLKKREDCAAHTGERAARRRKIRRLLGMMLVSGVCIAVNNKFNLYLSGVMDSAVFFPIANGGNLILTALAAVVIFREKLSKKQWLGVVIGIVSVVLLCDPFA